MYFFEFGCWMCGSHLIPLFSFPVYLYGHYVYHMTFYQSHHIVTLSHYSFPVSLDGILLHHLVFTNRIIFSQALSCFPCMVMGTSSYSQAITLHNLHSDMLSFLFHWMTWFYITLVSHALSLFICMVRVYHLILKLSHALFLFYWMVCVTSFGSHPITHILECSFSVYLYGIMYVAWITSGQASHDDQNLSTRVARHVPGKQIK